MDILAQNPDKNQDAPAHPALTLRTVQPEDDYENVDSFPPYLGDPDPIEEHKLTETFHMQRGW